MLEFTQEQFELIKSKDEETYKSIGEVYCPYFKEKISFNANGLRHLKFKSVDKARSEQDQYMRFKLLHLAPEVLQSSHTLQGILETNRFERVRVNSRTDTILKPVNYFEFIAVIKRNRIKVIIKQIDEGVKYFWSIIPFWGMDDTTLTRILHDGVLEEDWRQKMPPK
jgi:hypothetical protein